MSDKSSSTVYLYKNSILYLHSLNKTTDGLWILSEPVFEINKENLDLIGESLLSALALSKSGVPHPADFKGVVDPLLKCANVKSYNSFAKNAKCLDVYSESGVIYVTPTFNQGTRRGYTPLLDRRKNIEKSSPEILGEMIMEMFNYCE